MAYTKPADLDGFITLMTKCDIRIRAQLAEDLVNFLSDYENSLYCSDLGQLIDVLIPFLTGSHFKVSVIIGDDNLVVNYVILYRQNDLDVMEF
jgi:CLIP-associating protein 1/2